MTDNFLDLFQPDPPAKPKATPEPVAAPVPVVAVIPDEPDTSLFDGLLDEPVPPSPVSGPEYMAPEVVDVPEIQAMGEVDPAPAAIEEDEGPSQGLTPEPVEVSQPVIDPVVEEEDVDQEKPVIGFDFVVDAPCRYRLSSLTKDARKLTAKPWSAHLCLQPYKPPSHLAPDFKFSSVPG